MTIWGKLMFAFGYSSLGERRQAAQRRESVDRASNIRLVHRNAFADALSQQRDAANSLVESANGATAHSLETVPLLHDTLKSLKAFGGGRG